MLAGLLLTFATSTASPAGKPTIIAGSEVHLTEADAAAAIQATAADHPVAIEISDATALGGMPLFRLAIAYQAATRASKTVCRGPLSIYSEEGEKDKKWVKVPAAQAALPSVYVVVDPDASCKPKAGEGRILLKGDFTNDEVANIVAAIRTGRLALDENDHPPDDVKLAKTNVIVILERLPRDEALALTTSSPPKTTQQLNEGQEPSQNVILWKGDGKWYVVAAGHGIAPARQ